VAGSAEQEVDRLISETLRALRPPPAASGAYSPDEPVDIRGEGSGLEGQVRVTAAAGGRLASIEIAPRAMRTDSQTLAAELLAAANTALEQVQAKVREAAAGAGPDPAALTERLREVQETALPRMQSFLRAVESLRQQSTGGSGGASGSGR